MFFLQLLSYSGYFRPFQAVSRVKGSRTFQDVSRAKGLIKSSRLVWLLHTVFSQILAEVGSGDEINMENFPGMSSL